MSDLDEILEKASDCKKWFPEGNDGRKRKKFHPGLGDQEDRKGKDKTGRWSYSTVYEEGEEMSS